MSAPTSQIGNCPKCNSPIYKDNPTAWCPKCDEPLPRDINIKRQPGKPTHQASRIDYVSNTGQRAIDLLRICAWLNLVAGIGLALYSLLSLLMGKDRYDPINPIGVVLTAGFLIEGVSGCVFLLVVCSIAENLIAIRNNTSIR